MANPREIWIFNHYSPKIEAAVVVGKSSCGNYLYYELTGSNYIYVTSKDKTHCTRKQAAEACCEYHNKRIKQEQKKLGDQKRLLGKFYLEEMYE